ncbi:MAG: helix-turn-helix domain-containing protein [Acidimicrobiales bacterium]
MSLQPSPAVVRAGELLRHLAAHPTQPLTVSELARRVGVPRATCDSLLLGLGECGLVRRDAARRYSLAAACIALGDAGRAANPALRAASTHAEALARAHSTVTAVTIRAGTETRVTDVFDFGPPFGLRIRVGESIALVPPFGASFVAWDDDAVDAWLQRAEPPMTPAEIGRYRAAIDAVRRRGYSITVATGRQQEFAEALERLVDQPDADEPRRRRDQAARAMAHSDYLTPEIGADQAIRLTQVSSPVFDAAGEITVSIMLLGPNQDVTASDVAVLGELVAGAAAAATRDIGGDIKVRHRSP